VTADAPALPALRTVAAAPVIAGWLLAATAIDLFVTRLASRMTIFIPKDPALAGPAAAVGRLAAFADALVPVLAVALLVALIAGAGSGGLAYRIGLAATAGVAALAWLMERNSGGYNAVNRSGDVPALHSVTNDRLTKLSV